MTMILHRHARELGYCNRGLRAWFDREGLDWAGFLKNGISVDVIRKRCNAMADRAIALAEREAHGQR